MMGLMEPCHNKVTGTPLPSLEYKGTRLNNDKLKESCDNKVTGTLLPSIESKGTRLNTDK
jgi:hypothetical protein